MKSFSSLNVHCKSCNRIVYDILLISITLPGTYSLGAGAYESDFFVYVLYR